MFRSELNLGVERSTFTLIGSYREQLEQERFVRVSLAHTTHILARSQVHLLFINNTMKNNVVQTILYKEDIT